MFEVFGIPSQALFGQLMIGLINGAFYAMMSLGLALIFGVLNIINFTHGVQYMMGAFFAWLLLQYAGVGYWPSLILAPIAVGITGLLFERLLLRHLYHLDHLYGLLLTFGLSLLVEGLFRHLYGVSGQPYQIPEALEGSYNLGFMFLPNYRVWVVCASLVVCLGTWWLVERTQLGAYLRAATENPTLVRAFGVNVPRMITLTYVFGAMLAAFAGVSGGADLPGQLDHGLQHHPDHLRGGGDRRIGLDHGVDHHRLHGRADRGADQGFLSGSFEHDRLRHHGRRPAGAAAGPVRQAQLLRTATHDADHGKDDRPGDPCGARAGAAVLRLSGFPDAGAVHGAVCLRVQSAPGLRAASCRSGMRPSSAARPISVRMPPRSGAFRPSSRCWPALAAGGFLGFIYGILAARQRGIYLAMITFALAQMVYFIAVQAPFTGGEDGIQAIPRGSFLGIVDLTPSLHMYYFVLGVFVLSLLLIYRIIHSPFGQVLRAMRDNEQRAISLGYRTSFYKVAVFVMSGALSGLAGGLKALVLGIATLADVYWHVNGEVILMTLLGGLGTFFGPVVGALLVVMMQNYLAQFGAWVTIIQGLIFVVFVMAFRRGIVGELGPVVARLIARGRPARPARQAGARRVTPPSNRIRLRPARDQQGGMRA